MLTPVLIACAVYSALCLVFVGVNFALVPRLSRESSGAPGEGAVSPFLSIVVPARNEERGIGAAVRSMLAQDYPFLEVVVVNDRSTDRTAEILRAIADSRLRVIDGAEPPPGWLGKPHALAQGASAARGEILLFVDADVRYAPEAVRRAVVFLDTRRVDFVGLLPRLETASFWEHVLMPNLLCAVFFGPSFLVNARRPKWLAAGGGAGNLVRRRVYEAIGGHEPLRASVIDDVRLAVAVKRAGYPVRVVLADDLVAVRMYVGFREIWGGFTKNVAYAFGGAAGVAFLLFAVLWTAAGILPPLVVLAAAAGFAVSHTALAAAIAACAALLLARVVLAAASNERIWPALFHPVMVAVWAALLVRSLYQRMVRRSVVWRGRAFDARKAGF